MASFPFRPPRFSDDVAWLPPWLQSNNQVATPLNEDLSLQNMDSSNGNNKILSSIESRYKICHLYLSGEENSLATLTPSCQKVLQLNLHLSADGLSSIVPTPSLDISQDDKHNFGKGESVQPDEALHGPRETSLANAINLFPPSKGEGFGDIYNQTRCKSGNPRQKTVEIFNSKGSDSDAMVDAVELSIAASEALVIHELAQRGPHSEALSAAAILEVALRVKQARLDRFGDCSCCSLDEGNSIDILSDLSDADMKDAYQDVGISFSSLDNILLKDTSISQVRDTPMSEVPSVPEREVQSEWKRDQEFSFNNSSATKFLENNLDCNKSEGFSTEVLDRKEQEKLCRNQTSDLISGSAHKPQHGDLNDLLITEGINSDMVNIDRHSPHQTEAKSCHRELHSGKASEQITPTTCHLRCIDIDNVSDKSSRKFQSRWFGGWTGQEGDACAGKESKIIPKLLIGETSYLSESADVAPDQNSFVQNRYHCSKASESSIPLEGSCGVANEGGLLDQHFVQDCTLSLTDPLCSIVPCSISAEMDSSPLAINSNDNLTSPDAVKNMTADLKIPFVDVLMSSGHNDENVSSEGNDQLAANDIGPYPIIRRRVNSLAPYSMGLLGNSTSLSKRNFNNGLQSLEDCTIKLQERSGTYSHIDKVLTKPLPASSTSNFVTGKYEENHATLLSGEQHISCANISNENAPITRPPFRSMFSGATVTNNDENQEASGTRNAFRRSTQDFIEKDSENGSELQVILQDMPTSPLVLCRRTRCRSKAPKFPVADLTAGNQVENQVHQSDMICHKSRKIPQDQKNHLDSDGPARKKVRFSEIDVKFRPKKNLKKMLSSSKIRSSYRIRERTEHSNQAQGTTSQEVKERLTNYCTKGRKRSIFQGLEFLLTGFSKKKEKEIEGLLRKHGGMVLSDIPSPPHHPRRRRSSRFDAQRLPVIICTKKLQTTKFLYGCAVNAFMLKLGWAHDSIRAGSVLPPDKYVILSNQKNRKLNQIGKSVCQEDDDYIFDRVGIMLHGRHSFCSKLVGVIKHGRGQVFKSLQWLVESLESKKISVGAILVEDENRATRHLKKCASEQKIPVVPATWIINSLMAGKLLPFKKDYHSSRSPAIKFPEISLPQEWSQEI